MAYNLRLTPTLETRAREYGDSLGISLNALISVSLNAYLLDAAARAMSVKAYVPPPPPAVVDETVVAPPPYNASKKERQAYTAFQRQQRKLTL